VADRAGVDALVVPGRLGGLLLLRRSRRDDFRSAEEHPLTGTPTAVDYDLDPAPHQRGRGRYLMRSGPAARQRPDPDLRESWADAASPHSGPPPYRWL
jgi:hypothetical protein